MFLDQVGMKMSVPEAGLGRQSWIGSFADVNDAGRLTRSNRYKECQLRVAIDWVVKAKVLGRAGVLIELDVDDLIILR